jgi:hypothetical protein
VHEQVVIDRQFRGPPDSANGGYAAGLVAAHMDPDPAVEVTLRAPPPLDRPLEVIRTGEGVELRDGERTVAEGRRAPAPELELPAPVSLDEAAEAREASPMQSRHPYPMCFVCGSDRRADGLGVTCGQVPGRERELVAAPWETDDSMGDETGNVRAELVWSVLDCPSGIAGMLVPGLGVAVLGRLTGVIHTPLRAGDDYVAIGWQIGLDGRKAQSATAILDREGGEVAVASAIWIVLREQPAPAGDAHEH